MTDYDLIIRNAYLDKRDVVADIGIRGDQIDTITEEISATGTDEIDADGNLVGPGFVDCHLHIDKAFATCGHRNLVGHDDSFSFEEIRELEREYYIEATEEDITRNAIKNIQLAVAAGSTHLRTHVSVDDDVRGLQNMNAVLQAEDQTRELVDLQMVPGVYSGNQQAVREAIEMGLDQGAMENSVLVGGSDPATGQNDVDGTLQLWFDIASEHDIGMDLHIQDGGTLGVYTLERLVEYAKEYDYGGRVTASHSYALSNIPDWWLDKIMEKFKAIDMKLVTCYQSTRPTMPVRELLSADGVTLGHGTDNDRDFVFPHGNADSLEGALIESNKLHGDRMFVEDYRWFDTNQGLKALWEMITHNGAEVMGVEEEYGVEEGIPADLVVFDRPSPQWAIITQATRSYVIKRGQIVAKDGEILPDYRIVDNYDDVLEPPLMNS